MYRPAARLDLVVTRQEEAHPVGLRELTIRSRSGVACTTNSIITAAIALTHHFRLSSWFLYYCVGEYSLLYLAFFLFLLSVFTFAFALSLPLTIRLLF